jgi:hypothetical protein
MQSLYRGTIPGFIADCRAELIERKLLEAQAVSDRSTEPERRSWRASLLAFADLLETDTELCAGDVFVEFLMPHSGRRCDVLLTGRDAEGFDSAVLVELKQWGQVTRFNGRERVSMGGQERLHPSVQVGGYVRHLRHFHSAFVQGGSDAIRLHGIAWLHNMPAGPSLTLLRDAETFGDWPHQYRVFGRDDGAALLTWLRAALLPGPAAPTSARVLAGSPTTSQQLLDVLVRTIEGGHEWNLLDRQRLAYWAIRDAVQKAKDAGGSGSPPVVVIVRGGPGTGKSVLAVQLLADAARQHWRVIHATGSKAFQTVLQAKMGLAAKQNLKGMFGAKFLSELPVHNLFSTFAQVAKAGAEKPGCIDLVVADEAHRLWNFRKLLTPAGTLKWQSDVPMVRELVAASRVTAFFLDDNQSVRAGEIGRSDAIEAEARAAGATVVRCDLDHQYRCAGSDSYIRWVDGLVGHRAGLDHGWRVGHPPEYELILESSMPAMAARIRRRQDFGERCRIVAGYCWRWSRVTDGDALPHDLVDKRFDGWTGAWIEKTGQNLHPEDHQYYKWATMESHRDQVGSIYSAQGFEFDYVGVIWGDDLVWRQGRWLYNAKANRDGSFKRQLRTGGDPVAMLLNVYRVLLTRGMRGTSLFVLDAETRAHLAQALEVPYRSMATAR